MHGISTLDGTMGRSEHAGLEVHFEGADFKVANVPQVEEGLQREPMAT